MTMYISDLSIVVLIVFYLPIVFGVVLWIVLTKRLRGIVARGIAIVVALIVAYAIPLGDVTLNSIAMAKVCPKAGLHVYRTVKVEGYFDRSGSDQVLSRYPYRFIETRMLDGRVARFERQPDGRIVRMTLDRSTAEYEVVYDPTRFDPELNVYVQRWWVRERSTGDAVGEWLTYSPLIGWADRHLLIRWFGGGLGACDGEPGLNSKFPFILLPTQ